MKKIQVKSADARQYLVHFFQSYEPRPGDYGPLCIILGANYWGLEKSAMLEKAKLHVQSSQMYRPKESDQVPEVIEIYARLLVDLDDEELEIKSINQIG